MLRFFIVLSFSCLFHANANPIDNLLSTINAELPKILETHDEFSASIIRSVYDLRDTTSNIIFTGPWNATLTLSNILKEAARTLNQTKCIARGQLEWKAKIPSINSDLYKCVSDYIKMGDEIRKKIQKAYENGLKIREDVLNVRQRCLTVNIVQDPNCISRTIEQLNNSFSSLLKVVTNLNIEAQTIIAKILSAAMNCNAMLLKRVLKMTIDYQEMLRKCIVNINVV